MIETGKSIAQANDLQNVEFRRCNSKDFEISEKADVLIHEQIGSAIFNEDMIENVTDLRDRVLKAGGRILPNRFKVFLEPVEIKEEYRVPFIWEFKIHGISFEALKGGAAKSSENGQSLKSEEWVFIRTFEIERLLCNPKSIMQFDLETMTNDYKPGFGSYTGIGFSMTAASMDFCCTSMRFSTTSSPLTRLR